MKDQKATGRIYLALGFHVNYNHSYRGDSNDAFGFGRDTAVIRDVVRLLDRANAEGIGARGTWDFDNYWSVENCMKLYAPETLDAIARRVRGGVDEAILESYGNTLMSCMTRAEFVENFRRTISNERGSGVRDVFGGYSPVVRAQEMMFTHGMIELLAEFGVKAISLYYSAVPFDAMRNFVQRLTPNERYNPLTLRSTESDASILVIPTYHQGDILDNVSLENWLRKIRKHQKTGGIPGDALLYLNMDADAEVWTGVRDLPKFLRRFPNARGLEEFIEVVEKLPYVEFGTLGDYIAKHDPAGEIELRQDTADGAFTGYHSWAEKTLNQRLWRLIQRSRRFERIAVALMESDGVDAAEKEKLKKLLYGESKSYMDCKIKSLSTTHFGLAVPMIHPDRLRVAFHYAATALKRSSDAAGRLAASVKTGHARPDELMRLTVVGFDKSEGGDADLRGGRGFFMERLTALGEEELAAEGLSLVDENGEELPFDVCPEKGTVYVPIKSAPGLSAVSLQKSGRNIKKSFGPVTATDRKLTNGSVEARIDGDGTLTAFSFEGEDFAAVDFLTSGLTFKVRGRERKFTAGRFAVDDVWVGRRGVAGGLTLGSRLKCDIGDRIVEAVSRCRLTLFNDLPYLFVDGAVELPKTPERDSDRNVVSSIPTRFDSRWMEVMPFQLHPNLRGKRGRPLRVWKRNFLGVTNSYELNFGEIDARNSEADSFNNHVTDGWVAVSDGRRGLLVAHDQSVNSSPAMCPMRLRERNGRQHVYLNPFGTYFGGQFSHLPDGSGVARLFTMSVAAHLRSTAPTFNGEELKFRLMLAPYFGDRPPDEVVADAGAFSLPPGIIAGVGGGAEFERNPEHEAELSEIEDEHGLNACAGWEYGDFLAHRNTVGRRLRRAPSWEHGDFLSHRNGEKKEKGMIPSRGRPAVPAGLLLKIFAESVRSKLR